MKLILKEYLASLKERDELDAILPDLLSQMGLNVILTPSRGHREYGVDIAAVGNISGGEDKLYLFSVKEGNLTRSTWAGTSVQGLRRSLDEIQDSFIRSRIPAEHKNKPIEICLCFGGDISSSIRQDVVSYIERYTTDQISFSEWNGDQLAEYIEQYFLQEDIAPKEVRSLLRKSLSMIDEPDSAFTYFRMLVNATVSKDYKKPKDRVSALRQIHIYTWVIYAWCREASNLETAYLSSELALLVCWDVTKEFVGQKDKQALAAFGVMDAMYLVHQQISYSYLKKVVEPHCKNKHAISTSISRINPVDINIKLFDLVGRIAILGIWKFWEIERVEHGSDAALVEGLDEALVAHHNQLDEISEWLAATIMNNPMLFSPYKDEQAIDVAIVVLFLLLGADRNKDNITGWLDGITRSCFKQLRDHGIYPSNLSSYDDLIRHPEEATKEHLQSVTKGSILYPYIALFSALLNENDTFDLVRKIKSELLEHCNFQVYFFDEDSEDNLYLDLHNHGATLSNVNLEDGPEKFIDEVTEECINSDQFKDLSAMKYGFWPIILMASRHYRKPVPMHFYLQHRILAENEKRKDTNSEQNNEVQSSE